MHACIVTDIFLSELLPVLISGEQRWLNFGFMKGLTRFMYARPVLRQCSIGKCGQLPAYQTGF
jgi:hypothetical protein